jgi:hypothetical protein
MAADVPSACSVCNNAQRSRGFLAQMNRESSIAQRNRAATFDTRGGPRSVGSAAREYPRSPNTRMTADEQLEDDRRDRDRALLGRQTESDDVDA